MIQGLVLLSLGLLPLAKGALVDGTYRISPNVTTVNPVSLELQSNTGNVVLGRLQRGGGSQSWQVETSQGQGATIQNVADGRYAGSSNPSDGSTVQGVIDPFFFSIEPAEGGLYVLLVPDQDLQVGVDGSSAPGSPVVFRPRDSANAFRFDKLD